MYMSKHYFADRMCNKVLMLIFLLFYTNCNSEQINKSKIFSNYFRKQVEETEDTKIGGITEKERSNLVNFLIKNVKEIFKDVVEKTDTTESKVVESSTSTFSFRPINQTCVHYLAEHSNNRLFTYSQDVMLFENLSLTTLIDKKPHETNTEHYQFTQRIELLHLSKDPKSFRDSDETRQIIHEVGIKSLPVKLNYTLIKNEPTDTNRSCIFCNNVIIDDCNDPKNKLIPSIVCDHDDDLCYSLHTPFGIIDRGCFNVNRNLTTYVCSCNLCNYISISEMPYIYSSKQEWVDNVIELSRTRNFRKSVYKDMSCLRCEVNATTDTGDMLDSANCLEGNIGNLPVEECEEDEVCVVKAIKSEGYVWRGCTRMPLYNYWWSFCNSDLCNYDTIISIYDFVIEENVH